MNDSLTIFVNTHSSAKDCLPMFFGQLHRHWPNHPRVVVAIDSLECPSAIGHVEANYVLYSAAKKFSSQYLMGLCAVETPYVLPLQEDFLMYGDVRESSIAAMLDLLYDDMPCARLIDSGRRFDYSMQASVWRTDSLKQLYASMNAVSPWDAERDGNIAMTRLGMGCHLPLDDEMPMRGRDHRDSFVFPYCATALVKGKWNAEYRTELEPLHKTYGIDAAQRGWSA